ncbi:hypothetical protein N2152v2_001177 [Parachlorella kessleri]
MDFSRLALRAPESGEQGLPSSSSASSSSNSSSGRQTTSGSASSSNQGPDYYKQASQRLQGLLAGVGDGEEELVNGIIMDQTPEQKIALSAMAGGMIAATAFFICWMFHLDPLGGASLSMHSLQAAALGAAASLPLVVIKAYLWSEHGKRQIGWVEDWHRSQVECFKPLMHQLTPAQTLLFMASEVVPGVLILLPAAMGGIEKALLLGGEVMGYDDLPPFALQAAALLLTATAAGVSKLAENMMTLEEYDMVKGALDNADRYYKVMTMSRDSKSGDAQRAADAFRTVALTWMARSQLVSQLAAGLAVVEVVYLGMLWQETGDLAAPLVAALAASSVDFAHIRRSISLPKRKQASSSSAYWF